jgi:Icc-related predicted phosphoesterase
MKLLVIADIDDFHWNFGSGMADALISCGDVRDNVIMEAAKAYNCCTIFAVKGNHDTDVPFSKDIISLHLEIYSFNDLRFGGFSGCWRYKPIGYFLYDQEEVEEFLRHYPPVDVFVAHNSPRGIHDREDDVHIGFRAFNSYVKRARPEILIHGHQHINKESKLNGTRVLGVFGYKIIEI